MKYDDTDDLDSVPEPRRTYAPMLTIRTNPEFRSAVNAMAAKERISAQKFCLRAITKELLAVKGRKG